MDSSNKKYLLLNLIFVIIIITIFVYSLIYQGNSHPVPALLTDVTGIVPPSKGLSSSFSEIMRGNFAQAEIYNAYGLQIFFFFIIQLMLRVLTSIVIKGNWIKTSKLVVIDITFSVLLFLLCFAPLISYTFKLFAKLF